MSSGVLSTIRLEPFYQSFLRAFYECEEIVFKFPREDADELHLARKFNGLLMRPPIDYEVLPENEWSFKIEVPYVKGKNEPMYCWYISHTRNAIFSSMVEKAFKFHFHEKLMEYRNLGYQIKDCIQLFMDEYNIDVKYTDRLIKDSQRWRNAISNKKYRKKIRTKPRLLSAG